MLHAYGSVRFFIVLSEKTRAISGIEVFCTQTQARATGQSSCVASGRRCGRFDAGSYGGRGGAFVTLTLGQLDPRAVQVRRQEQRQVAESEGDHYAAQTPQHRGQHRLRPPHIRGERRLAVETLKANWSQNSTLPSDGLHNV